MRAYTLPPQTRTLRCRLGCPAARKLIRRHVPARRRHAHGGGGGAVRRANTLVGGSGGAAAAAAADDGNAVELHAVLCGTTGSTSSPWRCSRWRPRRACTAASATPAWCAASSARRRRLIAGEVAALFGDYGLVQELMLGSARGLAALDMRRDLLHWEQALKLATALRPGWSRRCSQASTTAPPPPPPPRSCAPPAPPAPHSCSPLVPPASHAAAWRRSAALAQAAAAGDSGGGGSSGGGGGGGGSYGVRLLRECAAILEDMRHRAEAAALWEASERALAIYLAARNMLQAAALAPKVTLNRRSCEAAGQWGAAAAAHERARDHGQRRAPVPRPTGPLAAYCSVTQRVHGALKVCGVFDACALLQQQPAKSAPCGNSTALQHSRSFIKATLQLARWRRSSARACAVAAAAVVTRRRRRRRGRCLADALRVARYYKVQGDLGTAKQHYAACGQHRRGLQLGEAEVAAAIDVVGRMRNDMLMHTLIDYLMGETGGVLKDPNHIYHLYLALDNYQHVTKLAIMIAIQEQDVRNNCEAHAVLYQAIRRLEDQRARVPQALRHPCLLLHS
ncbi:hypothetical protein JKP88DRAFT_318615 [Tribonema minus]|uniref:Uncharacterized protein n=1 Tax=Tribonema minus TaxID=303371 RepID=A0A836CEW0_9STRA|nr:hypothetical protein JKP88DRAFT_318615 [Tribonema minus]